MRLREQMERQIRLEGKSDKTFQTYWPHVASYIRYCRDAAGDWQDPIDCGRDEIAAWLTWLANDRHVADTTQNTALQAVLYLYHHILHKRIDGVNGLRAKRSEYVPDVPDPSEIFKIFEHLEGVERLAAMMMYGTGVRIGDLLAIRIKDLAFEREQITLKEAKGKKGRYVSFPKCLHGYVRDQMDSVQVLWKHDQFDNPNGVGLPKRFRSKAPNAAREFRWYYLFPSDNLSKGHEGILCRHHRDASHIQRCIKRAADRAGILKRITCHSFRHAYACHFIEGGGNIDDLMKLLGHKNLETTQIYFRGRKDGMTKAKSPIEDLLSRQSMPDRTVRERSRDSRPAQAGSLCYDHSSQQRPRLRIFAG